MLDPFVVQPHTIKHRSIRGLQGRWLESIAPPTKHQERPDGEENFLKRIITPRYFTTLGVAFSILFSLLLGKTAYLQIVQRDAFHARAEKNRTRLVRIPAERGLILDRNGVVLAKNTARFGITLNPLDLPRDPQKQNEVLAEISKILEIDQATAKAIIHDNPAEAATILDNIPYDQMLRLAAKTAALPGVTIDIVPQREYPDGSLFSHVLGYVGKISGDEYKKLRTQGYQFNDSIGQTGIEAMYEEQLRGADGVKKTEVDALGKVLGVISSQNPRTGSPLTLSIDRDLQSVARDALAAALTERRLKRGAVVAMTPQGEILAMVSLPDFDLNAFASQKNDEIGKLLADPNQPLFNRIISGAYPPGSTIKPLMALAALSEQVITENTTFISTGGLRVGQWFFPDWRAGGHGATNVTRAIAESINTFFYIIGGGYGDFRGLGLEKIAHYATLLRLGTKTGIDLPGEAKGFVPTEEWKRNTTGEPWYIGDTYHISIGQGYLLTTPLQIASVTATIANGGSLYQPSLMQGKDGPPLVKENIIGADAIKIVQKGMRQTVVSGSGRQLGTLPVTVAGKTGTAQWQPGRPTLAWFTGFAPYENPEMVITVMVEEGGEGNATAVPVVKKILEWYFSKNTNAQTPIPNQSQSSRTSL